MSNLRGERSAPEKPVDAAEPLADALEPTDSAAPPLDDIQLSALIEASIFASPEPIPLKRLARIVGEAEERVAALTERLTRGYEERASGLMIRPIAGGYQIATRPEHRQQLEAIVADFRSAPLSLPAWRQSP